jgi:hypothetical protein
MLENEHLNLFTVTLGTSRGSIDAINVYNASPGSERTNEAVELLMKYQGRGNALIYVARSLPSQELSPYSDLRLPTPRKRRVTTTTADVDKVVSLPVYRTTPIHLLSHAAGISFMDMALDGLVMHQEAIQMSLLDPICYYACR